MTTNEAVDGTATGTISVPTSAKLVRFKTTKVKLAAGKLTKVTLKLSKRNLKPIRRALRHHKLKTLITINVSDAAGSQTITTRTVELTG
jgi:hypothetical protein